MKVAFYKAEYGTWFDKLIAFWTRSKYSHVELITDTGNAFSASDRAGKVRFANINFDSGHWDLMNVSQDPKQVSKRMAEILGKPYDFKGVFFWFVIPHSYEAKDKYWCSEAVAYVLGIIPSTISPQRLYEVLSDNNK